MEKQTRSAIDRTTQRLRRLLEDEFAEQLEGTFDILPDGRIPVEPGPHLDAAQRLLRLKLVEAVHHFHSAGKKPAEAVGDFLREVAFTFLNRMVALKMLEARELFQECVSKGESSAGFKEFGLLAPGLAELPDKGYRLYLESLFDELGTEIGVLFDRRDPASLLWPRRPVLQAALVELNKPELSAVWAEDETLGWVYQFFNSGDERRQMRDESQAPRNSRELAVRNQFFTPSYVVQFLTDNTLGRTWIEMRQGVSRLTEQCKYLVRYRDEVYLGHLTSPIECPEERGVHKAARRLLDGKAEDWPRFGDDEGEEQRLVSLAHTVNAYPRTPIDQQERMWAISRAIESGTSTSEFGTQQILDLMFFTCRAHRAGSYGRHPRVLWTLGEEVRRRALSAMEADRPQEQVQCDPYFHAYRPKKDPRDLKILDPACGSGHFLLYAFGLLVAIYLEAWEDEHPVAFSVTGRTLREDYPDLSSLRSALPVLILENNLYGVEIDPRCAQIASLALWIRAQSAFGDLGVRPADRPVISGVHIVVAEPIPADEELVRAFASGLQPPLLQGLFRKMVSEMALAGLLGVLLRLDRKLEHEIEKAREAFARQRSTGSLLPGMESFLTQGELDFSQVDDEGFFERAEKEILAALRRFAESAAGETGVRRRLFAGEAAQGLALLDVVQARFDVVMMNPPFGACALPAKRAFEGSYPRTRNDLYSAFVERGVEVLHRNGLLGAITSRTGFFLSSFKKWREGLLMAEAQPLLVADLGSGVLDAALVEVAAYVLERQR